MANVARFNSAQKDKNSGYAQALMEISAGHKTSHWIWYIFPQLKALAGSSTAIFYGIVDFEEACDYLRDPVLFNRYDEIVTQVEQHLKKGVSPTLLMGSDIDAMKLTSSLTLFREVASFLDSHDKEPKQNFNALKNRCDNIFTLLEKHNYYRCAHTLSYLQPMLAQQDNNNPLTHVKNTCPAESVPTSPYKSNPPTHPKNTSLYMPVQTSQDKNAPTGHPKKSTPDVLELPKKEKSTTTVYRRKPKRDVPILIIRNKKPPKPLTKKTRKDEPVSRENSLSKHSLFRPRPKPVNNSRTISTKTKRLIANLEGYINDREKEWSFHFNFLGIMSALYYIQDLISGTDHFNSKHRKIKIDAATKLKQLIDPTADVEIKPLTMSERAALDEGRLGRLVNRYSGLDTLIINAAAKQDLKNTLDNSPQS
jgi:uncharacterized protein (DUF1810 family)